MINLKVWKICKTHQAWKDIKKFMDAVDAVGLECMECIRKYWYSGSNGIYGEMEVYGLFKKLKLEQHGKHGKYGKRTVHTNVQRMGNQKEGHNCTRILM
jgi:hypothetical protein